MARLVANTFQGNPCRNGHAGVRRVDNRDCVDCARERYERFIAMHPEKRRLTVTKYYSINKAVVKSSAATWKKANPEKVRACSAAYLQANLAKHRANQHARRVRIAGSGGFYTQSDIDALCIAQDGMCAGHCGRFLCDGYEIDHIVAVAIGGSNWPDNLQLLCASCNRSKGTRSMAAFLAAKGGDNFRI